MWNDRESIDVKRDELGGKDERRRPIIFGLLAVVLVLSACSSAPVGGGMMEKPTEAMMEKPTEAMMDSPQWLDAVFTNATTGESFKIGDHKGKVVLVELMAQWCSTCLRQQREVVSLVDRLGPDDELVVVALDIDPNEGAETLKAYSESHGFGWIYAIAPAEVSRELGMLYGPQYLNPPSAPMLLINRKGEVTPLPFGVKSADDLHSRINSLLNEGM